MSAERVFLYDTTLRDGAQTQGVHFTLADKQRIALQLDRLGVDWIEGGWPGANPVDDRFFAEPPRLARARLAAFGMTRRAGRSAGNDPGLAAVLASGAPTITLVGKSSARQVEGALGATREENLEMIGDSIRAACARASEVMFDAEHFFDGFKEDPGYALACLEAAAEAGARWLVLCDTNGGTLPHEVTRICERVLARFPGDRLGIHAHNDTGNAVANSLAAVLAGVRQVQGTLNGLGERCGNADLVTLLPTLVLKLGFATGVAPRALEGLTQLSRTFDESLNRTPDRHRPYVGAAAFAHKAGLHASAVLRDPSFYEHIDPARVGNTRDILVSDQAGRANLLARLKAMGLEPTSEQLARLLSELKAREAQGFAYEDASASFELLARRTLDRVPDYFELLSFRVIDERRRNAKGELVTLAEATTKVRIGDRRFFTVAEGNGPVNALDVALRQALAPAYPSLEHMRLVDYRVRILAPERGTAAVTRVLIESADDEGRVWETVGVSGNIIDASFMALHDAITWKLLVDGVHPPTRSEHLP
ncbi:MAG: citramalate synthase [Geminicoccaceae bacterium]|nr:citramalate synthase [Geminicoccaceae bacterium]MDW8123971.1 citramalate synthase [Geminicoccaceae bacterium]